MAGMVLRGQSIGGRSVWAGFLVSTLLVLGSGCAQTQVRTAPSARPVAGGERVLIMMPDVVLYELTAAGLLEPKAEWTEWAEEYVLESLKAEISAHGEAYELYHRPPDTDPELLRIHDQLFKLHDTVSSAILLSGALPTKKDRFEWNLGPGTRVLSEQYSSRYALFVLLRDSYATTGRKVLIATYALMGVGVPGGVQRGVATLVDLQTGEVLWSNVLASSSGDLRTPEEASDAVAKLLKGCPL